MASYKVGTNEIEITRKDSKESYSRVYFERYEVIENDIKKLISVWYSQTNDVKEDINVIESHGSPRDLDQKKKRNSLLEF